METRGKSFEIRHGRWGLGKININRRSGWPAPGRGGAASNPGLSSALRQFLCEYIYLIAFAYCFCWSTMFQWYWYMKEDWHLFSPSFSLLLLHCLYMFSFIECLALSIPFTLSNSIWSTQDVEVVAFPLIYAVPIHWVHAEKITNTHEKKREIQQLVCLRTGY